MKNLAITYFIQSHNESINFNLALLVYTEVYILTVEVKEKF
jgi:hypothetical protein